MDRFTQKLGGLPVWTWALILGLVFVAVLYWSKLRNTAASAGGTVPTAYDMLGSEASLGGTGVGSAPSSDPVSEFVSNATWETQGVAMLTGQGVAPFAAQVALQHYINGDAMTATELEWVNRVIASKGLPPQGNVALSEIISPTTGRTPSQDVDYNANAAATAADKAAADAAARAQAEADAAASREQQQASQQAAAQAAAEQAAAQQEAQRQSTLATLQQWLTATTYHSWVPGPTELAVINQYGMGQQFADAHHQYDVSQNYLSNFRRKAGWTGPAAVAARVWLSSHGYATS